MTVEIDHLVDQIAREVLTALKARALVGEPTPAQHPSLCSDCRGMCAQRCADAVRQVIAAGATRITARPGATAVPADLARYIDHTLLKPDATPADIARLCEEARKYRFASVCVNPVHVRQAAQLLKNSGVVVTAVVGFPLGAATPDVKAMEARRAIRDGAREIDMVINIGALKAGDYELVKRDMARVVDACHEAGAICKVIIEAGLLTDEEKIVACQLAKEARADFVKTSTGFGPGGATERDVVLMRLVVGSEMGVKAAGGIKTTEDALRMIRAGATRIGASAGVAIVKGASAGENPAVGQPAGSRQPY